MSRPHTAATPISVDVLILSYNTRDELRRTLSSLLETPSASRVIGGRVIVLDNASVDGSADMLRAEFPSVDLLVSDQNVGFGEGMNQLVVVATADYVLLLNSDVVIYDDFISALYAALNGCPAAVAAGPRLCWPDGSVQFSAMSFPTLRYEFARFLLAPFLRTITGSARVIAAVESHDETLTRTEPWCPEFLWATCWLVRRVDFLDAGGFDPAFPFYDEDLDLCRRWAAAGRKLVYVPMSQIVHIGGASTASNHRRKMLTRARRTFYRRHHGRVTEWQFVAGSSVLSISARVSRMVLLSVVALADLLRSSLKARQHNPRDD